MIKYLTIKILKYFDLYYQLKLFKFLKIKIIILFIYFDIGAHMGRIYYSIFKKF